MLKYGVWDLPGFDYFTAKNPFIGSGGGIRFKVTPQFSSDENQDSTLFVEVWTGEKCYQLSEIKASKSFPFEEQSLYEINLFLNEAKRTVM